MLRRWAADPDIACVVLHGAGEKAFCAGGDTRSLYQLLKEHPGVVPNPTALTYFADEYRLDYLTHRYPKPLLVWGSGIVLGGGLGLMAGASHRVVTETSRIGMPEVTIGLFPDVGASWFEAKVSIASGGAESGAGAGMELEVEESPSPVEAEPILEERIASLAEDYSTAFFDHGLGEFEAGDFVVDEIKRERFFAQLREWREQGWKTFVFCNNEGETERLHDLLPPGGSGRCVVHHRHSPARLHVPRGQSRGAQ